MARPPLTPDGSAVHVTVRLPRALVAKIDDNCALYGGSRSQALRDLITQNVLSGDEYSELYSELCDAAARVMYGIPENDPHLHTSDVAREIANRVATILERRGMILES